MAELGGEMKRKEKKKTLLELAQSIEPKPYVSRMGWETHPLPELLDLTIAYCMHKVGASAYTKVATGQSKSTNAVYTAGMVFSRAWRAGLLHKTQKRAVAK